jgi:hypothetical protein
VLSSAVSPHLPTTIDQAAPYVNEAHHADALLTLTVVQELDGGRGAAIRAPFGPIGHAWLLRPTPD